MKSVFAAFLVLCVSINVSAQTTTGVKREVWAGATLASLNDLAINPNLLGIPTGTAIIPSFQQTPQNAAGKFVARYLAMVTPPVTGNYTFWVAANQFAKVWINSTGNFANQNYLCQMTQAVAPLSGQYTKYPEQKSSPVALIAGQVYYILVVQFESGDGVNHMALGWQLPSGTYERPIPGKTSAGVTRLQPASYPVESTLTANPATIAPGQSSLLTWIARNANACTASASPATSQWTGGKPISGNASVTPTATTTYYLVCDSVSVYSTVTVRTAALNPHAVQFDPSPDHYLLDANSQPMVQRYDLEFYLSGASAPFTTTSLGKPSPGAGGSIVVDFSGMLIAWPFPIGDYQARVSAIGSNGIGRSDPSNIFTYVR